MSAGVDVVASIDLSDESWTEDELKRVCAERALDTSGSRDELVARIEADVAAKYAAATAPPAEDAGETQPWTESPTDINAVDTAPHEQAG